MGSVLEAASLGTGTRCVCMNKCISCSQDQCNYVCMYVGIQSEGTI